MLPVEIIIFAMTVTLGVAAARTSVLADQGSYGTTTPNRTVLLFASMLMTFSMLVWGLAALAWYWPIIVFLIVLIFIGAIVPRSTWPLFFQALPLIACANVAAGIYLWTAYWPF
jgi:hypothetical protein